MRAFKRNSPHESLHRILNAYVYIYMFVKIFFDGSMSIIELAKFCGVAPCQILAANLCTEAELIGREIHLPVSTPVMVRELAWVYKVGEDGHLVKVLH